MDYGADTQRGTHPPKPPTLGFQLLLSGDDEEPDWTDGDRVHLRLSIDGAAEFTYFVGSLEGVKADRLTGRTVLSARGYGLLALLPADITLALQNDETAGALFVDLLGRSGGYRRDCGGPTPRWTGS